MTGGNSEDEAEGVIKFQFELLAGPPPPQELVDELNLWRAPLFELGLIGRQGQRYGGLAFGNLSMRDPSGGFIITGSQTGDKKALASEDYCKIIKSELAKCRVVAVGMIAPSSETLSHSAIYEADPAIRSVVHVHCPELWGQREALKLRHTNAGILYGTQGMGLALREAVSQGGEPLICMTSHTDGIIAYGSSVATAVNVILQKLMQ